MQKFLSLFRRHENNEQITPNVRARSSEFDSRCLCGCWDNSFYWCGFGTTATAAEPNIVNLDDQRDHDGNPYDP
jgi:hypothetical protein